MAMNEDNPEPPLPESTVSEQVVAIDGPSGSGKSTVARELAQRLGFQYLDTGAMYRAVTWHFLTKKLPLDDYTIGGGVDFDVDTELEDLELELLGDGMVALGGRDVSEHLRSREVESRVSMVSAIPRVRELMRDLQRSVAAHGPIVAEGRDMGSVVFPRAKWKFYIDAKPAERARRRLQDFRARGRAVTEAEVLEEIEVRDNLDSTRKDAPLVRADGAEYVDTTDMTLERVIDTLAAKVS